MSWSKTSPKEDESAFTDQDSGSGVPLPKYSGVKSLELSAQVLHKYNSKIRVHVVCSGFMYGNGEQNDIFYEFFRRAWVSLHPKLAALPVIGSGNNNLPTIHVTDLALCLDRILLHGRDYKNYLIAVDQSPSSTQRGIMTAITEGIGSGDVQETPISDVVNESWCEFMTVNVKLQTSACLKAAFDWKCPTGINSQTMTMLNEEFNYFRGLFPLKVFITGAPCSGKTYFAKKLNELYGIPHLMV